MKWFEQHLDLRKDPTRLVKGTQRVISVRLDYLPENTNCIDVLNDDKAYISRYALGRDCHKLMRKHLKHLGDWLTEEISAAWFEYFGFCPILEKHLAKPASMDRQTHIIIIASCWQLVFLGELLTDCPLPLTQTTEQSRCGSCSACLDICPTNAFPEPYQLDATKCISYLTIEHKGFIPEELRAPMGIVCLVVMTVIGLPLEPLCIRWRSGVRPKACAR